MALALAAAATASLLVWAYVATGATHTESLTFSQGDLSFARVGDYDLVTLAGARWTSEPGKPHLPAVPVRAGLPGSCRVLGVEVVACDSVTLAGTFSILPSALPQPLSEVRRVAAAEPDPSVYGSAEVYPRNLLEVVGSGTLAGMTVCEIIAHPLRYSPLTGKVIFYTGVKFRIDYETLDAGRPQAASPDMLALAKRLVSSDGPWQARAQQFGDFAPLGGGEVNYLIITGEGLKPAFEPLKVWKMRKGLRSEIITVETIMASYLGSDVQAKVRNCIADYRTNHGTEWVLLGGDIQLIPDRKAYVNLSDKTYIPCDLYYADLDGSWNADGDLYWGEVASDNVDMYADVFLGRAPVGSLAEAETFVAKVLAYEGCSGLPDDYQLKMLFLGEILWGDPGNPSDPDYTDGGVAKDLVDQLYVPPAFAIQKLYQSADDLCYANTISALDQGMGIVNICAHGHYKTISVCDDNLSDSDMAMLTTDGRYGVMYSMSCLGGGFDQSDCIGEAWVLSAQGGGFYVGNSRYGWGTPGEPAEGPSDSYDQAFFESVFTTGFTNLGKAHADAKHGFVGESRVDEYMLYLMYGLNLLGDPETSLWTSAPKDMQVACAPSLDTSPQVYEVAVTGEEGPLAGAKVCLWKADEVYEVGETGPDGSLGLPVDAASVGALLVTVTASNYMPYAGEATVSPAAPHPAPPENLAAEEVGGPAVGLVWSPVDDDDLTFYKIYRNTTAVPQIYCMVAVPETAYTDASVEAGSTYYYWVTGLDALGNESSFAGPCSVAVEGNVSVPDRGGDRLAQVSALPNPFIGSIRLVLETPEPAQVSVKIFDADGRYVHLPQLRETARCRWEAVWDGEDSSGRRVAPGIYFAHFTWGSGAETRKVMMLR
ncbi:MAG: C25 family cysteine peptidase [bacterium]